MRFIFSLLFMYFACYSIESKFLFVLFCSYSLSQFSLPSTLPSFFHNFFLFFIQWHFLYGQINGRTTFNDQGKLQMLRIKREKKWPKVQATITKMACLLSIEKNLFDKSIHFFCVCVTLCVQRGNTLRMLMIKKSHNKKNISKVPSTVHFTT